MKKIILFITAILIGLTSFAQMGSIAVAPGYGSLKAAEFQKRTIDSGATYLPNVAPHEFDVLRSYGIDPVFALFPASQSSGAVMAHIPTDGTGDGTMSRNSTSYSVNYNGYLEPIATNTLAVDYSNGIPYFATYPQRTNLITYPKSLGNSYWTKSGATIEGSPSTAGSELVTNGTFATDTDWTKGTDGTSGNNWTISGGQAVYTSLATTGSATNIFQSFTFSSGQMYKIEFTVDASCRVGVISTGVTQQTLVAYDDFTAGTYIFYAESEYANTTLQFSASQVSGSFNLDDFSVKEVTGYSTPLLDSGTPTTEAYKLVEDGTAGVHRINKTITGLTGGNVYNTSIIAKADERNWIKLFGFDGFTSHITYFDLTNGVVGTESNATGNIEYLVDGWYRCDMTFTLNASASGVTQYYSLADTDGSDSYTGDGTSGIYICYPQLEEGSYASPLMLPSTEGSTTTRLADAVTGFGDAATFSSVNSSGAMIVRMAAHADDGTNRIFSLSDGTNDNRVHLFYNITSNTINANYRLGGVTQIAISYAVSDITNLTNVGFYWAQDDFSLIIDGVEVGTDTSGNTSSSAGFDEFKFEQGSGGAEFAGKTEYILIGNFTKQQIIDYTTP